jgi:L-fucono-1,5-lactonase
MTAVIDAHMHFWRYRLDEFGWLDEPMAALRRNFLPESAETELLLANVRAVVAVQARQSLIETAWLIELMRSSARVCAVVGWVDLTKRDVAADLDRFAGELAGVRHILQSEPDPSFMLRPDFQAGLRTLTERDLTYDILIFPRHLRTAIALVDQHPKQRFVLDHLAKPPIASCELEPWATELRDLARRPNVSVKLSGLVTEANWQAWKPPDFRPYFDVAREAFGAKRILYGSDYPVCTVAASYGTVKDLLLEYAASFTESERADLFGGNAQRFYRISDEALSRSE